MRTINDAGLRLIKQFEGCRLKGYLDGGGVPTLGYGHTGSEVKEGLIIDQAKANELLKEDLSRFEAGLDACVPKAIIGNQFSALVCLAFNIGLGNFKASTLLKKLEAGQIQGAALEFLRWAKDNGKTVPGLARRRQAEKDLFLTAS